jgi:hypothetical protein
MITISVININQKIFTKQIRLAITVFMIFTIPLLMNKHMYEYKFRYLFFLQINSKNLKFKPYHEI